MGDADLEAIFPACDRKSQCWTVQHKYPRTTYNVNFWDWSKDLSASKQNYYMDPVKPLYPQPIMKRFRPLHPMNPKEELETRMAMFQPPGRKTPLEAMHYGYRKMSLNPTEIPLRKFDDPLPHLLHTVKRESYTNPADRPQLHCPQNYQRYGLTPRNVAVGIVPVVGYLRPPPWSEDSLFEQMQEKQKQKR